MSEQDQARVHCSVGDISITVEADCVEAASAAFEKTWTKRIEEARDPSVRGVYEQDTEEQEEYGGYSVGD